MGSHFGAAPLPELLMRSAVYSAQADIVIVRNQVGPEPALQEPNELYRQVGYSRQRQIQTRCF